MPKYMKEDYADHLRSKSIDIDNKKLLITNFNGTDQEQDLTLPPNCHGFGRIRHFNKNTSKNWPENPLPIYPASKALNLKNRNSIKAQVFQNSSCNWRCWYCFVPFNLLSANSKYSDWKTPEELIQLYLTMKDPPKIIDLTGGQPDLIPEWVPWMMDALNNNGLEDKVYLWSDDNLSNDFFWRYLNDTLIDQIKNYKNYGRVCCFKGFNKESFSFNTKANPILFDQQFKLFKKLMDLGIDVYAYATFTTPVIENLEYDMLSFIDKLQQVHELLPLRTIPLEIQLFSPVESRLTNEMKESIDNQWKAISIWNNELKKRFEPTLLKKNIVDISLNLS